jgi:aminodeoxyfutalosine synthase
MGTMIAGRHFQDSALAPVADKVFAGRRLSFEDGVTLYRTPDLLGVAQLANHVREQKHGDAAYFV